MKKILLAIMSLAMACGIGVAAVGCGGNSGDEIHVFMREDGSGTRDAFEEKFGVESPLGSADTHNSTSAMMNAVAGDAASIGYASLGSVNTTVKKVTIGGVEASEENIYANIEDSSTGYAYWRYFNLAYLEENMTGAEANVLLQDFYEYIMSSDAQAAIEEEGYFSTTATHSAYSADPAIDSLSGDAARLTVGGSSSVSPLMEVLVEDYEALHTNVDITVQTLDSTAGATNTISGTYDLGMLSRELKDEEKASLQNAYLAVDGIAVIVNNENSVSDLTAAQVKDIFEGTITTWSAITGSSEE